MQELAPGVHWLPLVPPYGINAYLVDNILIDAGTRYHRWLLPWLLRRQRIVAHALTHAHPDHQGASHAVCTRFGIPLWCGAGSTPAMETGTTAELLPPTLFNRSIHALVAGPPHPVERVLREGDAVGDFEVIETPGHCPGHLSFWRERDRVLILGDVLANCHPITQQVGLREPDRIFTPDPAQNRKSARRMAALRPRLVCFGHGPPLRDAGQFQAFVAALPR